MEKNTTSAESVKEACSEAYNHTGEKDTEISW